MVWVSNYYDLHFFSYCAYLKTDFKFLSLSAMHFALWLSTEDFFGYSIFNILPPSLAGDSSVACSEVECLSDWTVFCAWKGYTLEMDIGSWMTWVRISFFHFNDVSLVNMSYLSWISILFLWNNLCQVSGMRWVFNNDSHYENCSLCNKSTDIFILLLLCFILLSLP